MTLDLNTLLETLVEQASIKRFSRLGYCYPDEPSLGASKKSVKDYFLDTFHSFGSSEQISTLAEKCQEVLLARREMLDDYFSIRIARKGELVALPDVLAHVKPNWNRVGLLLGFLAVDVDWENVFCNFLLFFCIFSFLWFF